MLSFCIIQMKQGTAKGGCIIWIQRIPTHTCQGYPGYFWEPHWKSVGHPRISRVTWWPCILGRIDKWNQHNRLAVVGRHWVEPCVFWQSQFPSVQWLVNLSVMPSINSIWLYLPWMIGKISQFNTLRLRQMAAILQTHFQMHFLEWKCMNFD